MSKLRYIAITCGGLHNLVPFEQFKKQEKHPWRNVAFSKVKLLHGCCSHFLDCVNSTKLRKASHLSHYHHLQSELDEYDLLCTSIFNVRSLDGGLG